MDENKIDYNNPLYQMKMTGLCRTCLTETHNTDYINISSNLNKDKIILDCIVEFSSVQVLHEDPLPQSICNRCYMQLYEFYIFRDLIVTADKNLKGRFHANSIAPPLTTNTEKLNELKDVNVNIDKKSCDKSIASDFFENEDTQSHNSDNIKSDTESDLFDKQTNLKYLNVNNNAQEYNNCLQTRRTSLRNKPSLKEPNSREKNTIEKLKKKRVNKSKIQKRHECKECQKVFKKADHLNVHITYKHAERQFKCEICEKKFARKYDLAYHRRVHTGERPFTCEMCGKSFASSSYFYMHKRIHTGLKKMKCEFCQNSFNNSDQLQIHVRQKHTGERPFLCEMCSHAFTSSSALYRHKRDVHDEKVGCPICNKLYSSRVLKDHIKRHTEREEGIKRFSCDLCGKRFTCATSRKRHLVIHSGEKAFKCEVCDKSFNQRSTLQTHMRIHSQVMPFHCEICSKCFRYKHHLKIHCEKHHKNENCTSGDTQHYANIFIKSE